MFFNTIFEKYPNNEDNKFELASCMLELFKNKSSELFIKIEMKIKPNLQKIQLHSYSSLLFAIKMCLLFSLKIYLTIFNYLNYQSFKK